MKKIIEQIDGLILSLGVSAAVIGVTYFSKLYYFLIQEIPLSFLSFEADDFTKFSIIPIILVCLSLSIVMYARNSIGQVLSKSKWIMNSITELLIWLSLFACSAFLLNIDNIIFKLLLGTCSILMWIHGASLIYSVIITFSKKAKSFYAEALALRAEAEFLMDENQRIIDNTNIPSGSGVTKEGRKQLHKNRVSAYKARFTIEKSLEDSKGLLAELMFDFGGMTKYAKILSLFIITLSLNCSLIKLEANTKQNRFESNLELSAPGIATGVHRVVYSNSAYFFTKEGRTIKIINRSKLNSIKTKAPSHEAKKGADQKARAPKE